MYYLVQGHYPEFGIYSKQVLVEAGAIAIGIILASYLVKLGQQCKVTVDKYIKVKG